MVQVTTNIPAVPPAQRGYWSGVLSRLRRDPVSMICAGVLALLILSAVFAPWLGLADPYQGSMIKRLAAPGTPGHLLGTDEQGRDMLSRLIFGARYSLFIGIVVVGVALVAVVVDVPIREPLVLLVAVALALALVGIVVAFGVLLVIGPPVPSS